MATLWAVEGPHRTVGGLYVEFCRVAAKEGARCVVSRDSATGLHLDHDPKVTRGAHARVLFEEGEFWLVDAGSANGTFTRRGDALDLLPADAKARLDMMDEFVVGDTVVVFRVDEPDQAELDATRDERHAKGVRDARTLPRKPAGTHGPTLL